MNIRKIAIFICVCLITISICGCANKKDTNNNTTSGTTENNNTETDQMNYKEISQDEAKELMDTTDAIILDVRTQEEYDMGHIPGAIVIPYDEIKDRAESEINDKNATILVYCRSGNRSKIGAQNLANLGYTNVQEFGGINTWKYKITR